MIEDDSTAPELSGERGVVVIGRRYNLGAVLGAGGMGEVRLARDTTIDRDVAIKLMRTATTDKTLIARFFREAKVQGKLDHPAVVPVHDLGFDAEGQPYFVMKRLAGTTLLDVLVARTAPQRTLLARLVDICLAIDFAHARGVVHRDLKPSNIMLGDYGEAYVLDWGLARIVDELSPFHSVKSTAGDGGTEAGALLGTPGYMSPEQARGEDVDTATDVFALGCVLFEILAGERAMPGGLAAIAATLAADDHRPSTRADVPPELDELCVRATAQQRAKRPTARQLADEIQAYLDGDRDLERRRVLAQAHVANAKEALSHGDETGRAIAMREAGRAFVLDPTNRDAQDVIAKLTLEAPKIIPVEALRRADHERAETRQLVFKWATAIYLGIACVLALLFVLPVRHAWPIVLTIGACVATAGSTHWSSRAPLPMMSFRYVWMMALNSVVLIGSAYIFGPLLIIPAYVVASLTTNLSIPGRFPTWLIIALHLLAIVIPIGTELLGWTARTFSLDGGALTLVPYALDLSPVPFALVLLVAMLALIANAGVIAVSQRRMQERVLDAVHAQSWHLKQLLPDADDERS